MSNVKPEWTEEDKILYLKIKEDMKNGLIKFKTLESYKTTSLNKGNAD